MSYANLHGYNYPVGSSGDGPPIASGKPKVVAYKKPVASSTWSGSLMAPGVDPISNDMDEVATAVLPSGYNDDPTHVTTQGKHVYLHKDGRYYSCRVSVYFVPYTIQRKRLNILKAGEKSFPYNAPVVLSFYRGSYTVTTVTDELWEKLKNGQMGLPIITWQGMFFFAWSEDNYTTTKPNGVILEYGKEDYEAYNILKSQAIKIFGSVTEIPNRLYKGVTASQTRKFNGKYIGSSEKVVVPSTPTEYLPGGYANVSLPTVEGYEGKYPVFNWTNQLSFQNYVAWCYAAINTTRYLYDHPSDYGLNGSGFGTYGIFKKSDYTNNQYTGDPFMRVRYQQFGLNDRFEPCYASGANPSGNIITPYGIPNLSSYVPTTGQLSESEPIFGFGHGCFNSVFGLKDSENNLQKIRETNGFQTTVPVGLPKTVITPIKYDWTPKNGGRYATGYISFGSVEKGESGGCYCKEDDNGALLAGGDGLRTSFARTAAVDGIEPRLMNWNMYSVLCFSHKRGVVTVKEEKKDG